MTLKKKNSLIATFIYSCNRSSYSIKRIFFTIKSKKYFFVGKYLLNLLHTTYVYVHYYSAKINRNTLKTGLSGG